MRDWIETILIVSGLVLLTIFGLIAVVGYIVFMACLYVVFLLASSAKYWLTALIISGSAYFILTQAR